MTTKIITTLLACIAVGATAFAIYLYISQADTNKNSSATPSPTPTPTSTVDSSVKPSPSATPETLQEALGENQPLSLPNDRQKIAEGGSLSTLAQSKNMTVARLAKLNGIADPNKVFIGQSVILPDDVSGDTMIILFVTNTNRSAKESARIAAGLTSLYSDPVTAAQADAKGLYGLAADTPYSKGNEAATSVTLSTTDAEKVVSIQMEKLPTNLWVVKRVTIKVVGS